MKIESCKYKNRRKKNRKRVRSGRDFSRPFSSLPMMRVLCLSRPIASKITEVYGRLPSYIELMQKTHPLGPAAEPEPDIKQRRGKTQQT